MDTFGKRKNCYPLRKQKLNKLNKIYIY
jgi:hypothetical protein